MDKKEPDKKKINQRMKSTGQILGDGRFIAGTTTDPQGTVSAVSLQR